MLLGRGCMLYSLVLSYDRSPLLREIRSSYCHILGCLQDGLADLLPGIACAGTSDLAAAGLKISGNAQQRKRDHILHHGSLLYDFDAARIGAYLRMPNRQPEYRSHREHEQFVRNLDCTADELRQRLIRIWNADPPTEQWPEDMVRRLVSDKYANPQWNQRR